MFNNNTYMECICIRGRMQDFDQEGQLSNCNNLSGSNSLTNRVLNKKINNLIYILI
jgi:hypothetical protein